MTSDSGSLSGQASEYRLCRLSMAVTKRIGRACLSIIAAPDSESRMESTMTQSITIFGATHFQRGAVTTRSEPFGVNLSLEVQDPGCNMLCCTTLPWPIGRPLASFPGFSAFVGIR